LAFDFPASPTVGTAYTPSGGPSYIYDGVAWTVVDDNTPLAGTFKISEGILSANANSVDFAVPTTGYRGFELHVSRAALDVTGGVFAQLSWDNGATYKSETAGYLYAFDSIGTTSPGGWAQSAGTTNVIFLMPNVSSGAPAARGNAKLWWPLVPAGEFAGFMCDATAYSQTTLMYHRWRIHGWAVGTTAITGPHNRMKVFTGGGSLMLAGLSWQLNGIK